jgi:hypothetical protein
MPKQHFVKKNDYPLFDQNMRHFARLGYLCFMLSKVIKIMLRALRGKGRKRDIFLGSRVTIF